LYSAFNAGEKAFIKNNGNIIYVCSAWGVKTFSENVESALRKNDADKEATFCSLVRNWYHSEDEPGIPAIIRCKYRLELREWLLNEVKFGHFPPSGAYVNDIPIIL
jgi:hypothetical protein